MGGNYFRPPSQKKNRNRFSCRLSHFFGKMFTVSRGLPPKKISHSLEWYFPITKILLTKFYSSGTKYKVLISYNFYSFIFKYFFLWKQNYFFDLRGHSASWFPVTENHSVLLARSSLPVVRVRDIINYALEWRQQIASFNLNDHHLNVITLILDPSFNGGYVMDTFALVIVLNIYFHIYLNYWWSHIRQIM